MKKLREAVMELGPADIVLRLAKPGGTCLVPIAILSMKGFDLMIVIVEI